MTTMTQLNVRRLALGGLVAGAFIFIMTGAINGGLLSGEFAAWSQEMQNHIHPPTQAIAMTLWTLMSFMYGILGVWIYASIRPRYGAGPKTAILAGIFVWLISKLTVSLDLIALGILPVRMILEQLMYSFVVIIFGVLIGAWIYKE